MLLRRKFKTVFSIYLANKGFAYSRAWIVSRPFQQHIFKIEVSSFWRSDYAIVGSSEWSVVCIKLPLLWAKGESGEFRQDYQSVPPDDN